MTTIYFVRHAEPNYQNHDDVLRELSTKGMQDRKLVTQFLLDKQIDVVLSSPYKRAIDTVADFADTYGFEIKAIDNFRERKVDSVWIDDFTSFCKAQWADFNYKLSDGETLGEVQKRNISGLMKVLNEYKNKNIVVGSHGTALSTIINYYDQSFGYAEFEKIRTLMPWIVRFTFQDTNCINIQMYDLFEVCGNRNSNR
jgi:2,3-bisphosphoglycerate-dependent phosphoglycerate mutase